MTVYDVQSAVDALASRLHRSVVVIDPSVRLLWASPHYGDEDGSRIRAVLQREATQAAVRHIRGQGIDSWTTPGVIPASAEAEMQRRVAYPLRHGARMLGLLLVIDADSSMTLEERDDAQQVASEVTWPLYQFLTTEDKSSSDSASLVEGLLAGDRQSLANASAAMAGARYAAAIAVRLPGGEHNADERHLELGIRSWLRRHPQRGILTVGDGEAILIDPHDDASRRQRLEGMAAMISLIGGDPEIAIGVGPRVQLGDLNKSAGHARLAASAAELLPDFGQIAAWTDLGCFGVLLRLPPDDLTMDALPAEIQNVLGDPRGDQLTRTLEVYLDHGSAGASAAAELHVHRTTLYYRLRRVEELSGLNLSDGRDRLRLHMGVKQARLVSAISAHGERGERIRLQ